MIIGLLNTSYTVYENDGEVNIQIGTLNGSLEIDLLFVLSFIDLETVG